MDVNGVDTCKPCGGDPNQKCCDGSCCYKVWTKETVASSTVPCPSCGSEGVDCGGTTTELESYEKCLNVGVGQGEHCECTDTWQPVGHEYPCMINWDIDAMQSCAEELLLCIPSCIGVLFEPASCADCLCNASVECCGGGECEVCDFIEDCIKDPLTIVPQKRVVFSSFGC